MSAPEEIKWHRIVRNLKAAGLTYGEIGLQTGFTSSQLMAMEDESFVPDWISILKLLDLHLELCPNRHPSIVVKE